MKENNKERQRGTDTEREWL